MIDDGRLIMIMTTTATSVTVTDHSSTGARAHLARASAAAGPSVHVRGVAVVLCGLAGAVAIAGVALARPKLIRVLLRCETC